MANPNKVFFSYADRDEKSRKVIEALSESWVDVELKGGDHWDEAIEKALENSQTFVFLLSPLALTSSWTNFEMGVAKSRVAYSPEVRIIPVLISGATWDAVPSFLRERVGIDANTLSEKEAAAVVAHAIGSSTDNSADAE